MADEITTTASMVFSRSAAPTHNSSLSFAGIQIDQTGSGYSAGSQTIGTSEENFNKGDIGTIGMVMVKNQDATNYVELGTTTGQLPVKLKAGESAGPFRVDATNLIGLANTAPCVVQFILLED